MQDSKLDPRSEAKKKKSSFRITSIIDPIKNDNSDDKEDSDSNEGVEDSLPASRFRMIPIQRPNPTTYNSGRWKVKEIYVVQLKEESKSRTAVTEKPKSVSIQSVTSNESIGDNARSGTPASDNDRYTTHSSESIDNIIISAPLDLAQVNPLDELLGSLRFGELENQVRQFEDRVRELVGNINLQLATANRRHDELLRNYRHLEEENLRLKEQLRNKR